MLYNHTSKTSALIHFVALGYAFLVVALLITACASTTQPSPAERVGYVTDPQDNLVLTQSGECVWTGFWERQTTAGQCDAQQIAMARAEKATAVAAAPVAAPLLQEKKIAAVEKEPEPQTAPELVRVFVGTDAYFNFNQAELTSQAKRNLDKVVQRTQKSEEPSIQIVGYTDRMGSPDYNRSLSQRRADAVRTYLIEQGVEEDIVSVDARGEDDPIVSCESRQGTSLIDCLQPNRRTEVELSILEPTDSR